MRHLRSPTPLAPRALQQLHRQPHRPSGVRWLLLRLAGLPALACACLLARLIPISAPASAASPHCAEEDPRARSAQAPRARPPCGSLRAAQPQDPCARTRCTPATAAVHRRHLAAPSAARCLPRSHTTKSTTRPRHLELRSPGTSKPSTRARSGANGAVSLGAGRAGAGGTHVRQRRPDPHRSGPRKPCARPPPCAWSTANARPTAMPLSLNEDLDQAAQAHSENTASAGYFEHTSPGGRQLPAAPARLPATSTAATSMYSVGENIAWGSLPGRHPGIDRGRLDGLSRAAPRPTSSTPSFRDAGIGVTARLAALARRRVRPGAMYTAGPRASSCSDRVAPARERPVKRCVRPRLLALSTWYLPVLPAYPCTRSSRSARRADDPA